MKDKFLFVMSCLLLSATSVMAQHAGDILIDYQANQVYIEPGPEGLVFESDFNPPNPLLGETLPFTDEPGFDTLGEATEVYNLVPGDIISYNVLGPLAYHNGTSLATAPVDLLIIKGTTATVTASSGFQGPFGIGLVTSDVDDFGNPIGLFHQHLEFNLSSAAAPSGAYGVHLQLVTTNPDVDGSEPFWIVFNWGLAESEFEQAVHDITTPVPEASTIAFAGFGVAIVSWSLMRRRSATG